LFNILNYLNMSGESLLVWLLLGVVAGWLASLVISGGGFGIIGNIIVGIIGSFLGGWLGAKLGISGAVVGGFLESNSTNLKVKVNSFLLTFFYNL
jgi:uncharacterized membrane protein YeaQ/YmgE (transglycosylase-associated protein family)